MHIFVAKNIGLVKKTVFLLFITLVIINIARPQTFVNPNSDSIKFTGAMFNDVTANRVIFYRHSQNFYDLPDNVTLVNDEKAKTNTGITINFTTAADSVKVHFKMLTGKNAYWLYSSYYIDGDSAGTYKVKRDDLVSSGDSTFVLQINSPSGGYHLYRIVLSTWSTVGFYGLTLMGDTTHLEPCVPEDKPFYLAYGNSITHGRGQNLGEQTYAGVLATRMGWELYNVAVGGSRTSVPLAEMIKNEITREIDYMTILIGYNDAVSAAQDTTYYRRQLIAFIDTVRESHPETTIFVIGQTYTLTTVNSIGDPVNFDDWRRVQKFVVDSLTAAGDTLIHYINGADYTGYDDLNNPQGGDSVHLSIDGAYRFGNALANVIAYDIKGSNIIHVATTGSDNNGDGTWQNPYASLTKASKQLIPGDTVYVHAGTYHNSNFGDGDIWKSTNMAWISGCNGTPGQWITFKPVPGDQVLLEFDAGGITIKNSSYIVFSGFEIKAMGDQITLSEAQNAWGLYKDADGVEHDLADEMGVDITDPDLYGQVISKAIQNSSTKPNYYNGSGLVASASHHIILENNIIHDVCGSAIRNQGGDYVTIRNNKVYHNTYWTTRGVGAVTVAEATVLPAGDTCKGVKIKIEGNEVFENENKLYSWNPSKDFVKFVIDEGSGIFLTRNNDTYNHGYMLIANNLSYLNGANGIVVHYTDRTIVENNTVYHNGANNKDSKSGGIGLNNVDTVELNNNISWARTTKSAIYKIASPVDNLLMQRNIAYNENSTTYDAVMGLSDTGWVETNPGFADTANYNFRLLSNSPAIDSAVAVSYYTDFYGSPRKMGNAVDIGAIEYGKYWTGKFDNDWAKPENWSDRTTVTDTSEIYIPSPSFYHYESTISSNTRVKRIFMNDSATLIINNNARLTIGQ